MEDTCCFFVPTNIYFSLTDDLIFSISLLPSFACSFFGNRTRIHEPASISLVFVGFVVVVMMLDVSGGFGGSKKMASDRGGFTAIAPPRPAEVEAAMAPPERKVALARMGSQSLADLNNCSPLWGVTSICGRREEMEDAFAVVPQFLRLPSLSSPTINLGHDRRSVDRNLCHLTSHFFGVYDGHGGCQVANYCRERVHMALAEEMKMMGDEGLGLYDRGIGNNWKENLSNCFLKVDAEIGIVRTGGSSGSVSGTSSGSEDQEMGSCDDQEPIAPPTVGSTAVVAVVSPTHIIVANCGDSRAVLCRGRTSMPLSVDHKPDREDENKRIEAAGGTVMHWNGSRVFGVLAMSRSIGDRYMKPWVIPDPEVMFVTRAKEDECLILASDGLWDVMSNEEACEMARKRILVWHKRNGPSPGAAKNGGGIDLASQAAAEYLSRLALWLEKTEIRKKTDAA